MNKELDFFLSYSRSDTVAVRRLYRRLSKDGFQIWFDQEELLPGQDWALEIERAIKRVKAVMICLSSRWVDEEGFVHDELKQSLQRMRRLPEGRVFLIPVRLDSCNMPNSLTALHWVDLSAPSGYHDLTKTLSSILPKDDAVVATDQPMRWDAVAEMLSSGTARMYTVDPWEMALSEQGQQFKHLLRWRFEESVELYHDDMHEELIELWSPLFEREHFRTDHPEWSDAPYFRCQIHAAHCQLFVAYAFLSRDDMKKYVPLAFGELAVVVTERPYSLAGGSSGSDDKLSRNAAEVQNENYLNTLRFAKEFLEFWGGGGMEIFGISKARAEGVEHEVDSRTDEVEFVLRHGYS
jgi:TIR domain